MRSTATRLLVVAGCLLAAALYLAGASRAEVLPPREPLAGLAMSFDGWTGRRDPDLTPDILAVLGADDYLLRSYYRSADAAFVSLYIGYHASQRQGDTIHSPLNCLPGAGWQPLEVGRTTVSVSPAPGAAAMPIEVNRVLIGKGIERQLVLYWYQSHRRVVASEYWGKIYTVLDSVRYNRTDAALVRIVVPVRDGQAIDTAEAQGVAFVQSIFPRLEAHLPV